MAAKIYDCCQEQQSEDLIGSNPTYHISVICNAILCRVNSTKLLLELWHWQGGKFLL